MSFVSSKRADPFALESFLRKYPESVYQDIVIEDNIYLIGTDFCESRYELIKPVLDLFDRPFSFLDLGAAQGYFSFRVAHDFPLSFCTMIEANDTPYVIHGDMLQELCFYNRHLNNITHLNKKMDLTSLSILNENQHFDVVIAFLVVHQIHESFSEQIKIIETLLKLGDNLIVEVANDVCILYSAYVEFLSEKLDCQYLGEVKRRKDPDSTSEMVG